MTKLFMRNNYDNPDHVSTLNEPMSYSLICLRCAGMMGGKINDQSVAWLVKKCDRCGIKSQVTQPRNYIWRT